MPGQRCAVAVCNNSNDKNKELSFFTNPKDLGIIKKKVIACKRQDKFNLDTSRVCSDHFKDDDFVPDFSAALMKIKPKRPRMLKPTGNNMGAALCSALGHDESGSRPCPFPKFKQQHLKVYSKQEIVEDGSFSQSGSSQNSESEARSETDKIVTEPWKRFMTDMKGNGMKTFIIFLTDHPQYKSKIERLDKMTLKEIEEDEQMQRNVITAMCYITTIVHTLDYPESTRVVVQDIKNYCRDFDLPDKALADYNEVLIRYMKQNGILNADAEKAWQETMVNILYDVRTSVESDVSPPQEDVSN